VKQRFKAPRLKTFADRQIPIDEKRKGGRLSVG